MVGSGAIGPGGIRPAAISTLPVQGVGAQHTGRGCAALIHAHDWSGTSLGPITSWDPAVRAAVELMLASPVPMLLTYGPESLVLHNDAYADVLDDLHPGTLGKPAPEAFGEAWSRHGMGDVITQVYRTGRAVLEPESQVPIQPGDTEPAFYTQGHSVVRDSRGAIAGVLTVAAETTQVIHRLQSLGQLTARLAGALTIDDVTRVVLAYAMASFDLDHCVLAVDDGLAYRYVRRIRGEMLDEADERLPPVWRHAAADPVAPMVAAAESGRATFVADGEPLRDVATDRHERRVRALAVLPLRTPSVRGAFTVGFTRAHTWLPAERALLNAAAELVAQAAERARRFEAQHGTAQLLQRSMLPEHLPELDTFRIAARYDVGVDGNAAGGDFYDAFRLVDGRLAMVLGDVAGHDVRAAAVMGQVRAALRAMALTDPAPPSVLAGLDRLVTSLGAESRNEEIFVTVVYGVLDPADGTITLASAGHPPPVLRRAGHHGEPATAELVKVPPGAPLGLGGRWQTGTLRLEPGDTILMFSDGVVERRGHPLNDGLDALVAAAAASASGDPRNMCSLATAAVAGTTDDDVAVLAVEHAVAMSRSATMRVPAEPTGPSRVRQWMSTRLREWSVPEQVIGAAILCTSELTTNALLHAGTPAQVHIDLNGERLLVSVADTGTRGSVIRARADTMASRGRGLGLIEDLSDSWGTDPTVRGSTVWFEMLLTRDDPDR
ncbi:serine phosphatase RsbU (regulator of sigma subunit)/anti-sigma regulatory factor (Ser/Thr protein kinase) [Actinoplanes lutulentus]|uniref:Serine phosphatase RsbU (Regulator of sigma subunit) n=1 Tax=Actinoplanes lutulentus TaxID=1287878 RepID=A0A327ZDN9_9ACTN|nr:ATP-binding SpoIIE family protein phosphatase [Actinoplanes lutulentus]MBB2942852.1 serine phosphatase RsbU (regulator of sigma subunit)/anti-sigma regulatory factor (Ser/Thr protein kinase) [Actinoplanes lutulentus]RAK38431.1 serine phosphatase RsbU (regulator of sigma subunit) [Actinoplanes lutulentus]